VSKDDEVSDGKPEPTDVPPTRRHETANPNLRWEIPIGVSLGGALALIGALITFLAIKSDALDGVVYAVAFGPILLGLGLAASSAKHIRQIDAAALGTPIGIVVGATLFLIGALVTIGTLQGSLLEGGTYVIAVGPMVSGLAMFFVALRKPSRPARPRSDQPPVRESVHDMMNPEVTYPDDGAFAAVLRAVDTVIGQIEQTVLFALLGLVVFVGASHAIADKAFGADIYGHFKDDAIRGGAFAMALLGGAFAAHQQRHLAMDLVSRRMQPRRRLVLKVVLALFAIAMVGLLIRGGFHTIAKEAEFPSAEKLITSVRLAYLVPIGGLLIILHVFLHTLIDIDYLRRGKTPPEKMRTGH